MSALRRIARGVAKVNMKKSGLMQFCKQHTKTGVKISSDFSYVWRQYAGGKK